MSLSTTESYTPTMQPNRVRLAALFYPAPGITYEQFSTYWLQEHGRIFMSLDIVKKNLTKYEQFHFNNDLNNQIAENMGSAPTSFWGMAIFEAESYEKIMAVFSHPDYIRYGLPDEKNILDKARTQIVAGEFATIFTAKL